MGTSIGVQKHRIKRLINEVLGLNELFETPPFKTSFDFVEDGGSIESRPFNDPKNNIVKVYFHNLGNDSFEVDFTLNGSSYSNSNITYPIPEYTTLVKTVYACINQFLVDYTPNAIKVEGADTFEKIAKGKKGQKNSIYRYSIDFLDPNNNYYINTNYDNGDFELIKK
jgi:hypothetical protein